MSRIVAPESSQAREISSGVIVFRRLREEPYFLVLYHGHNQWTFPRGKIEGEEKSFAAALRETREETGLTRSDLTFVDYFKAYENWTFVKNNQKVFKTIIFYLAETSKKHIRIEHNFYGYCWFTYREALKVFAGSKNNENRKVLKQAYDFLKEHPLIGERFSGDGVESVTKEEEVVDAPMQRPYRPRNRLRDSFSSRPTFERRNGTYAPRRTQHTPRTNPPATQS